MIKIIFRPGYLLPKKKIINYRSFSNKNFNISTGEVIKKKKKIFFATLKKDSSITYRFVLLNNSDSKEKEFFKMVRSFKEIEQNDLDKMTPPKIVITSTSSEKKFFEETVNRSNLQKMYATEIHKSLNNLEGDNIKVGEKMKTVY